jgi:hypothetical protein
MRGVAMRGVAMRGVATRGVAGAAATVARVRLVTGICFVLVRTRQWPRPDFFSLNAAGGCGCTVVLELSIELCRYYGAPYAYIYNVYMLS